MTSSLVLPPSSPLYRLRGQRRLRADTLTILMPTDGYYVQAECARALRALGHKVVLVALGERGELTPNQSMLAQVLKAVVAHRPDLLLCINYLGFDRAGWLDEALAATGLPTAVWLVDNPFVLALGFLPPAKEVVTLFSWDQSYVAPLRAHGAERVVHLPLATCPHTFHPPVTPCPPALPRAFVGHSLAILCARWHAECTPAERAEAAAWARELGRDPAALHTLVPHKQAPIDRRVVTLAYANYLASASRRTALLQAVSDEHLHVFGDADWPRRLRQAQCHGSCAYGPDTARIFQAAAINLNVTNAQMPSTVNQRVFDVPACGGFLLTDLQPELEQYFTLEQEVATFASADELREKVAYYAVRPAARAKLVARAQRRIAAEHTYEHRMRTLLETMRNFHGRPAQPRGLRRCASPPAKSYRSGEPAP